MEKAKMKRMFECFFARQQISGSTVVNIQHFMVDSEPGESVENIPCYQTQVE